MKNRSVRAVAVVAAVLIAFGAGAPAGYAKPHHAHRAHTAHAAHSAGTHGKAAHGKASVADRRLARAQAKVARAVTRKDRALTRNVRDWRLRALSTETADAVRSHAAEDQVTLTGFGAEAAAATALTDVRTAAAEVRTVRPEGYLILENELRQAVRLQARVDALLAADPTAATGDVSTLLTSALDKATAYRSTDPKSALRSIRADLSAAADLLDTLEQSGTTTTDPTTTDPTVPTA